MLNQSSWVYLGLVNTTPAGVLLALRELGIERGLLFRIKKKNERKHSAAQIKEE
jgi:hypothetical protein